MGLKLNSTGGTGSVQLNAPANHNTDTTITLPADNVTGGEFVLADGNGDVNIGTSTARAGLTVALGGDAIPAAGASTGSAVFGNASDDAVYGVVVGANTSGLGYIQSQRTDGTATTYDLGMQPNGGNVGIGTTTVDELLHIEQNVGNYGPALKIANPNVNRWGGKIDFESASGASLYTAATIKADGGSGFGSGNLIFETAGSEFARLSGAGALVARIGTTAYYGTSSATNFHSFDQDGQQWILGLRCNASSAPFGLLIKYTNSSPDGSGNHFIYCEDGSGTMRMRVDSDGNVTTDDGGTLTSDATLKRDITDATPKLADVMNLKVRNYYWIEDYHPNKQDKKLIGFIAQEFEEVFPGLVSEQKIKGGDPILDEEGNDTGEKTPEVFKKGIKEAKLIPILVKAFQEAVERIETLEAKVAALEGGTTE